jgi:hypothetical protein
MGPKKRETRASTGWSTVLPTPSDCPDLDILKSRLRANLKVYKEAAAALQAETLHGDFKRTYQRAEHARLAFEHSREELNAHIVSHRCADVQL